MKTLKIDTPENVKATMRFDALRQAVAQYETLPKLVSQAQLPAETPCAMLRRRGVRLDPDTTQAHLHARRVGDET